jgi:predicted transcriptional regulator
MTKPIGVKLDDDLQDRLKNIAQRADRSPHWLMKKAISEFIEREESAEQEKNLLLKRWDRYLETNETVPHETVVNWLESWGTEKELPCPKS